jgi:hypothetical protein
MQQATETSQFAESKVNYVQVNQLSCFPVPRPPARHQGRFRGDHHWGAQPLQNVQAGKAEGLYLLFDVISRGYLYCSSNVSIRVPRYCPYSV